MTRAPKALVGPAPKASPRKTSRLREHETTAADTKVMILGAANVIAGVFGFFDSIEKGALAGDAAKKEIRRGKARARAMKKAEEESDADE